MRFRLGLPLAFVLLVADCTTKELAVEQLEPAHVAHPVIGDVLRFTLAYNQDSAMGLLPGEVFRWPLIVLMGIASIGLAIAIIKDQSPTARQQIALGMLLGGAMGNLLSRVASSRGVVDFIDVGIGTHRFYVMNVADLWISMGACLLAYELYRVERRTHPETVQ